MRLIRFKFYIFIFLEFYMTGLLAQNTLIIKETGKQTPYALKSIGKLTFADGKMIISQPGGNYHPYELTSVRSLEFVTLSTDILHPVSRQSTFILYPVPVKDQLQIRYGEKKNGMMHLEIADMQGRIVYRQVIYGQGGNGEAIIGLPQLAKGHYICRLRNGDQIETCKFLKE
jgi:hypothetical protein